MKTHFNKYRFLILLLIVSFCPSGVAQSNSAKTEPRYSCDLPQLGLFRQITGASIDIAEGVKETYEVIEESDVREKRWKPSTLDEIDPAYKIYLIRNRSYAARENCGSTIEVVGKLISPTGKLFDFKYANYDIPSHTLRFTTTEIDGITYRGEVQFYAKPISVRGVFHSGIVKLEAVGKALGKVSIEFPFTSWNSH